MNRKANAGVYIHIPFCSQKCKYCDFYSLPKCDDTFEAYKNRVTEAVSYYTERYERGYNSLYLGGGTPLLLEDGQICDIINSVKPKLTEDAEITIEGNPGITEKTDFSRLFDAGINRLSFGLQSSNERELKALGRIHSPKEAEETVAMAQRAGFKNISLDLMLGIPYQTEKSIEDSISFCADLGVTHISVYMLKIEEGTPLASSELRFLCADDERVAGFYLLACERLSEKGFSQYEISNFSKENCESRHNLKYWNAEEYLGIGPSAHGFMEGRRYYFERDLSAFLKKPFSETELFEGEGGNWEEYAMLRLRLSKGLSLELLKKNYPTAPTEKIRENAKRYLNKGLLSFDGSTLAFTPRGFLLSNMLTAEILY